MKAVVLLLVNVLLLASHICGTESNVCDANGVCEATSSIPSGASVEGKPREAVKECFDRHDVCKTFADQGECQANPGWMIINCPLSCQACHLRDYNVRCTRQSLNVSNSPAFAPGELNAMFSSMVSRFGDKFPITVLSEDPWVIQFDNFVTAEEAKAIIGSVKKWERSTDTGSSNEYGEVGRILSTGRTSSNAWCDRDCEANKFVKDVTARIEAVTLVNNQNYESFQILRYDQGQHYTTHHDSSEEDNRLTCGPRILTFFLYLSDVEEGGETEFPTLGLAVRPKKGRAILWPSVLDHDPTKIDQRTFHTAKPVKKGRKLAANSWIHLYDYRVANLWGCTGSFDELSG